MTRTQHGTLSAHSEHVEFWLAGSVAVEGDCATSVTEVITWSSSAQLEWPFFQPFLPSAFWKCLIHWSALRLGAFQKGYLLAT